MKKILIGAMLATGMTLGAVSVGVAGPGDGLDRNAMSQGNSNMGGMHSFQNREAARGGMTQRRMTQKRMMKRRMMRRSMAR